MGSVKGALEAVAVALLAVTVYAVVLNLVGAQLSWTALAIAAGSSYYLGRLRESES